MFIENDFIEDIKIKNYIKYYNNNDDDDIDCFINYNPLNKKWLAYIYKLDELYDILTIKNIDPYKIKKIKVSVITFENKEQLLNMISYLTHYKTKYICLKSVYEELDISINEFIIHIKDIKRCIPKHVPTDTYIFK